MKKSLDPDLPSSKIATGGLRNKKSTVKSTVTTDAHPQTEVNSSTDNASKSAEKPAQNENQVKENTETPKKKFVGLKGLKKKVKAKGFLLLLRSRMLFHV